MKWIRWPGLIAFVIVVIVIALVWFLLVDRIVHNRVEKYGTDIIGAKVELDSADVSLFPLGVELIHLQVTDPEKPMTNAVEVGLIEFSMDGLNLLRRKVIIKKMSIIDVELGTPRKTSGAIPKAKSTKIDKTSQKDEDKKKTFDKGCSLPSLDVNNVEEILKNEKLETLALAESLEKEIDRKTEEYKKKLKELPDKENFDEYEKRIKKLESTKGDIGGILKGVQEADNVIDDIKDDLKLIKRTKNQFKSDYASLKKQADELAKAPKNDIAHLKDKYSLSSGGAGNMSCLILGRKIGDWVEKGLYWYKKIDTNLKKRPKSKENVVDEVVHERGKGIDVVFKEKTPLPDLLIRNIETSLKLDLGDIWGTIKNVTPDQQTLGLPLTFGFSGEKLKSARSVAIDGSFDHTKPEAAVDQAEMKFYGYKIKETILSDREELPVAMKKGLLDMDVAAVLKDGVFDIATDGILDSVKLDVTPKESSGKIIKAISDSLSDVSNFTFKADVKGTFDDYNVRISSNIDDILKGAVKNVAKDQAKQFEMRLQSAVNEKVNGPIAGVNKDMKSLTSIDKELISREEDGNNLIKGVDKKKGSGKIKLPF